MVEWLAGNRIRGTSAEKPVLGLQSPSVGGWVELARTTLGTAGDTIDVSSLPDKRYYMILTNIIGSGSTWCDSRLNGDTDSNYALRKSLNGATDTTSINYSWFLVPPNTFLTSYFMTTYISNLTNKEKLGIENCVDGSTAGAGYAPARYEGVSKWVNTTDSISSFSRQNDYTGDYSSGSEIVVLGWDPADTHTTNFWEELASVELGTTADELSSGTITAKKYLMVEYYVKKTGTANTRWRFNNDIGSNYAARQSGNGGADGSPLINQTSIYTHADTSGNAFGNIFIVNNSANEKLGIFHEVSGVNTSGASSAPARREVVAKWSNTSAQITEIDLINTDTGGFSAGTIMKVWGSD